MAFHRLTAPTYFGGLPGGYDYINNLLAGTPALADAAKIGGPNAGTYFVAFGEDATSADLNRGHKALAQNCDALDDFLRRDIAITTRTADVVAGAPVAAIILTGPGVFCGPAGTPNTTAGINTFVEILDENDNEIVQGGANPSRVIAISPEAPGAGFSAGNLTLTVSPAIPSGRTYRVYYGIRSNLATLPSDAFTTVKVRAAEEVSGQLISSGGTGLVGSASVSGTPYSLAAGTALAQLTALLGILNADLAVDRTRTIAVNKTVDDGGFRDKDIYFNAANITLQLPNPTLHAGRELWLGDVSGLLESSTPVTVTLLRFGAEQIDGAASNYALVTPYGRWRLSCDGTDWFLFRASSRQLTAQFMTSSAPVRVTTELVMVDTTGGAVIATLPAHSPGANRAIRFKDYGGVLSTNALTLARSGGTGKIEDVTGDFVFEADYGHVTVWSDGLNWWFI
jgi:hypothetical protein